MNFLIIFLILILHEAIGSQYKFPLSSLVTRRLRSLRKLSSLFGGNSDSDEFSTSEYAVNYNEFGKIEFLDDAFEMSSNGSPIAAILSDSNDTVIGLNCNNSRAIISLLDSGISLGVTGILEDCQYVQNLALEHVVDHVTEYSSYPTTFQLAKSLCSSLFEFLMNHERPLVIHGFLISNSPPYIVEILSSGNYRSSSAVISGRHSQEFLQHLSRFNLRDTTSIFSLLSNFSVLSDPSETTELLMNKTFPYSFSRILFKNGTMST